MKTDVVVPGGQVAMAPSSVVRRRFPGLSSFAAILAVLVLAARPGPTAAQSVTGRVVSLVGDEPVPTAAVLLVGTPHHAFTDSAGSFALEGVRPGRYELIVQHPGYHTVRRTVDVGAGGAVELEIPLAVRVISLAPIRAEAVSPLERWRRSQGTAHHVFVTREELEGYIDRGARHVGDALRYHAPTAVHILEKGLHQSRIGPTVCIMSTRAATRRSVINPPGCAAVFIDGMKIGMSKTYIYDLPLRDIEHIEFLPPVDAITRVGHAGENGAVFITTRTGSPVTARLLGPAQPIPAPPDVQRHRDYLAAGATVGFLGAFGVGYAHGLFRQGAEFCESDCEWDVLQMVGAVALGLGVGEILYRLRSER